MFSRDKIKIDNIKIWNLRLNQSLSVFSVETTIEYLSNCNFDNILFDIFEIGENFN